MTKLFKKSILRSLNVERLRTAIPNALKPVAWLGFLLILGLSIWMRQQWPTVPIADPDTWGYLNPGLSWLSGDGLQQTHGRPWLYPAIVSGILGSSGSFHAIVWWQQGIGVLSLILLWIALRKWLTFLPAGIFAQIFGTALILLAIALCGLNAQFLTFETELRPESLFQSLVLIQLACIIGYINARWHKPNRFGIWFFGTLVVTLSYINLLLKPSWGFSVALASLPVLVGILPQRRTRTNRIPAPTFRIAPTPLALLTSAALVGTLVFIPNWLKWKRDTASITFLPLTLFSVHADVILQSIEKQAALSKKTRPNSPSGSADAANPVIDNPSIYPNFALDLQDALMNARKDPHSFRKLGFDADYIMYQSAVPWKLRNQQHWNDIETSAFFQKLYFDAWLTNPFSMLRKIFRQLSLFAFPASTTFYQVNTRLLDDYRDSLSSLPQELPPQYGEVRGMYSDYLKELNSPPPTVTNPRKNSFLKKTASNFSTFAPAIQLLFFVSLVLTMLRGQFFKRFHSMRLAAFSTLAISLATYGNVITIAIIHALDIDRYRFSYGPFYLIALVMMSIVCIGMLASCIPSKLILITPKMARREEKTRGHTSVGL